MKKSILIVSSSLSMGGLEKSLIYLCDNIDYSKYNVDLYLFNEGRELLPMLNKNVNLLANSPYYNDVYNKPLIKSAVSLLKKGKIGLCFYRIKRFIKARLNKTNFTKREWKAMKKTMLSINKEYDTAIGFEEGSACYYVADCVNAKVKSGWIHTDIKAIYTNRELDVMAFSKLDHICTISQNSLNSLIELYPEFKNKYKLFFTPSLFNYDKIDKLSKEEVNFDKDYINVVSVGRLVELKGFHLGIAPLKRLIEQGYKVKWYILGEGEYRKELEDKIREYNLQDSFILLGNQDNPYKYIKNADMCVQPSSYEGLSLVIIEEKYLQKAVIATNICSNQQVLENGKNGVLIDRKEDEIYSAIKRLIDDSEFRNILAKEPINGAMDKKTALEFLENIFNKKS